MTQFFSIYFGQTGIFSDFITTSVLVDHFYLWILAIVFCMPVRKWVNQLTLKITGGENTSYLNIVTFSRVVLTVVVVALSVALLVGATNNAFLYTRF